VANCLPATFSAGTDNDRAAVLDGINRFSDQLITFNIR